MARVTVEDCIDKVDNRFDLVLMASHRARAISSGAPISRRARQRQEPGRRAARDRRRQTSRRATCARTSSTRCRSRSRSTSRRPRPLRLWSIRTFDPARARRRRSVRPHDGGGLAARARRLDAAAGAGGRWRVGRSVLQASRCGALRRVPSSRRPSRRGGIFFASYPQPRSSFACFLCSAPGDLLCWG